MSINTKTNVVALAAEPESAEILPLKTAIPTPPPEVTKTIPASSLRKGVHGAVKKAVPGLLGAIVLIALWQIAALSSNGFPTPLKTWEAAKIIFAEPFYIAGPNDMGIGWNVLASLNPVIALLRPVSPLAWLPIGLLLFQRAEPASAWTIFICSIWPMILNTAEGVMRIPQDYLNVARVLKLSEFTVMRKILFPAVLPHILTGVRLSIGIAWLVIVAAEMLTGGVGIGFWIWNEWNNLNVENIIIAILLIGVVGMLLEQGLMAIARRFSYGN